MEDQDLIEAFRAGESPHSRLAGRFRGEFLRFYLGPVLSSAALSIWQSWKLWQGKVFQPHFERGYNIISQSSRWALFQWLWPFYNTYINESKATYLAFPFRTYRGFALEYPGQHVLKLDYNLKPNPFFTVRRVLDELVQVEEDILLGRAYLLVNGQWQAWAAFRLIRAAEERTLNP